MKEFKVGDVVKIKRGMSADSRNYDGKTATIASVEQIAVGHRGKSYVLVKEFGNGGIWMDELEEYKTVKIQTQYTIKEGELTAQHMTNTKNNSVLVTGVGTKKLHKCRIDYNKINEVIAILKQVQAEVEKQKGEV